MVNPVTFSYLATFLLSFFNQNFLFIILLTYFLFNSGFGIIKDSIYLQHHLSVIYMSDTVIQQEKYRNKQMIILEENIQ